jgi:hypothetical protein
MAGGVPCSEGLPVRLAEALGHMASFVIHDGRRFAPYEVGIRHEAIASLVESGLVPATVPRDEREGLSLAELEGL